MPCAVALAGWTGCLVTVFERDSVQLKRFRRAGHRFIHPDLNHRGGGDGSLIYDPTKPTRFPFMNWSGNYAPAFAQELVSQFDHYRQTLNIALHLSTAVVAPKADNGRAQLGLSSGRHKKTMTFDTVILATGFGEEELDEARRTNDTSYWLSGNPLSYRPLASDHRERVLISGNGDSAVIELAHILIEDFEHENIFRFLPTAPRLNKEYIAAVAGLAHRKITGIGVLDWFAEIQDLHDSNPGNQFYDRRQFDLRRDLYKTGAAVKDSAKLEKALLNKLRELASWEIRDCLDGFMLDKIYRPAISQIIRHDVEVVVRGRTPTIYSTSQAPLNWFLLRVLLHYGSVTYEQTDANDASLDGPNPHDTGDDAVQGTFDRTVFRRGADFKTLAMDPAIKPPEPDTPMFTPRAENFVWWMDNDNAYPSRRLISAQRYKVPLIDEPYPGEPLSPKRILRQADNVLWMCHGTRHEQKANNLYRQLKACHRFEDRRKVLIKLLKTARRSLSQVAGKKAPVQ